jgi:hypothetical protein
MTTGGNDFWAMRRRSETAGVAATVEARVVEVVLAVGAARRDSARREGGTVACAENDADDGGAEVAHAGVIDEPIEALVGATMAGGGATLGATCTESAAGAGRGCGEDCARSASRKARRLIGTMAVD